MKLCPNCSTENDDAAKFCKNCGKHLEDAPATQGDAFSGTSTSPNKGKGAANEAIKKVYMKIAIAAAIPLIMLFILNGVLNAMARADSERRQAERIANRTAYENRDVIFCKVCDSDGNDCYNCDGGRCPKCGGDGEFYGKQPGALTGNIYGCYVCGRTGICAVCSGKGSCDACRSTGIELKCLEDNYCTTCKGTGICSKCKGDGCSSCDHGYCGACNRTGGGRIITPKSVINLPVYLILICPSIRPASIKRIKGATSFGWPLLCLLTEKERLQFFADFLQGLLPCECPSPFCGAHQAGAKFDLHISSNCH